MREKERAEGQRRKADVATSTMWACDVAENQSGFALGGNLYDFVSTTAILDFARHLKKASEACTKNERLC